MSFTVSINVSREFETQVSIDKVFALLADVPLSASHFPEVEKLEDLGGGSYRWVMEKIGIGDYTLQQTIYACTYSSNKAQLRVDWVPVAGVGNALVEGGWRLHPAASGTKVQLRTKGELTVDMPGFLQFFLSPLIEMAFAQKIDCYVSNLRKAIEML